MNLLVGIPAYRKQIDINLGLMLVDLERRLPGFKLWSESICSLDRARNNIIERAMMERSDWLLMVDSDVFQIPTTPVVAMLEWAREHQPALVGPPAIMRGGGINATEDGESFVTDSWLRQHREPAEVRRVGFGMVALNMGWLRSHWPVGPWCQSVQMADGKWFDEGFKMCEDVGAKGGAVFVDPRFMPTHRV